MQNLNKSTTKDSTWRKKLATQSEQIKGLVSALEFYAKENHYTDDGVCFTTKRTPSTPDSPPEGYEEVDYGQVAREVLKSYQQLLAGQRSEKEK